MLEQAVAIVEAYNLAEEEHFAIAVKDAEA